MKNNILLTIFVSLLLSSMTVSAAVENPQLAVSLLSYSPVPAQPGTNIDVTISVLNNGEAITSQAAIELLDSGPFSVSQDDRYIEIGKLPVQQNSLAEYRVRVDSTAIEGTNYLKVRYTDNALTGNWYERELPITIRSADKTVAVNQVLLSPEIVAPGEKVKVDLKLKNLASSSLRDVSVQIYLLQSVVGTTIVDLPFAPIGSSTEKRISRLESGQTADFDFLLQVYPEAEAGIYKVPLQLMYTDENGVNYTRNDIIGIPVQGPTDVMITLDRSTLYSDGGQGDVSFSVINKGLAGIKFLTLTLEESPDYSIVSTTNRIYLGNVDSDDYETADFTLLAEQTGKDALELPLTLTFKDALNKEHSMQETLTLPLLTTAQAGKKSSSTGTIIIIVVVVLVVAFIIYRRAKKRTR